MLLRRQRLLYSLAFCGVCVTAHAQTSLATLVNFTGPNGSKPAAALIQGTDGNFYGTTSQGGVASHGTIFKMTPSGVLTPLHNFHGVDGQAPETPLVLGIDGNFYGTTILGGTFGRGTFFKMTPEGILTTLYNFSGADGSFPNTLLQGEDGNFYGTAKEGGANGVGSVFRITPSGSLTILYNFTFAGTAGRNPDSLIQGADGNFYGITQGGEVHATLFEITPAGALTVVYAFTDNYVGDPAGLTQSFDGNFFGFSENGGYDNTGTVFEITPPDQITFVVSFSFYGAGYFPNFLMQTANGTFYATTADAASAQGYQEFGSIFEISENGKGSYYEYIFYTPTQGATPNSLVQGTDGTLYGTTLGGGTIGDGTVFNFPIGEGAFIRALPSAGSAGTSVMILGNNLTGATSVTFNGVPAQFNVVSASEITATVPPGATTGRIEVITPAATLFTRLALFRVAPGIPSFAPPR